MAEVISNHPDSSDSRTRRRSTRTTSTMSLGIELEGGEAFEKEEEEETKVLFIDDKNWMEDNEETNNTTATEDNKEEADNGHNNDTDQIKKVELFKKEMEEEMQEGEELSVSSIAVDYGYGTTLNDNGPSIKLGTGAGGSTSSFEQSSTSTIGSRFRRRKSSIIISSTTGRALFNDGVLGHSYGGVANGRNSVMAYDSQTFHAAPSASVDPGPRSENQAIVPVATDPDEEIRRLRAQNKILANQNSVQSAQLQHQSVQLQHQTTPIGTTATPNRAPGGRKRSKQNPHGTGKNIPGRIGRLDQDQDRPSFLAGFSGYSPPLWFDLDKALRQIGCPGWKGGSSRDIRSSADSGPPLTRSQKIKAGVRLVFYCVIFLADFADGILDFAVSIREILGLDENEDENAPSLRGWAIWLFLATAMGRTLAGVLAIYYHRIDKADRENSYFLVELTIWRVEDMAALFFLSLKRVNGVEWTSWDSTNLYLTIVCSIAFLVPILYRWKHIAKGLPRCVSRFVFTFYGLDFLYMLSALVYNEHLFAMSVSQWELIIRITYPITVSMQLLVLYHWSRHLYKKEKMREQQQQQEQDLEHGEPTPTSVDGVVGTYEQ
eukprot:CAMPEP_0170815290 /NCGR_PEP_ID=MMETSP0733-20121128/38351_1 /TAXON_ID=186038 /ORGANISM="Fragilariopsis kerguelensis, Strain L26-C5" /LENGTH=602 /DNA_ID=CAMNT_0011173781 /DNA_START=205 /DNA_END=2014 /DNA_ORIENTATION=-